MVCAVCGEMNVALAVCHFCGQSICVGKCLLWKRGNDGDYHHCCASCKGIASMVRIPVAIPVKRR